MNVTLTPGATNVKAGPDEHQCTLTPASPLAFKRKEKVFGDLVYLL